MSFVKVINEVTRLRISVDKDIFYLNKTEASVKTEGDNIVLTSSVSGIVLNEPFYNFLDPVYNLQHHSVRELLEILIGYIGVPPTPGGNVDKHFTYVQGVPSSTWNIQHNLEKKPSVSIVDSADTDVIGEIIYIDNNNVQLNFSAAFSGKAYLN